MNASSSIPLNPLNPPDTSGFLTEDRRDHPHDDHPHDINDIFHHNQLTDDQLLLSVHPGWRKQLFALMELPRSSPGSFIVHVLTTALIVFSALVTVLETIQEFHAISKEVWFGLETMLVWLFTVEYIARSLAWGTSWGSWFGWTTSFFGVIDLLAILPYYIEIMLQSDTSVLFRFSILRMFRLLRVFRPFRYNNTILLTIEVMYLSVRRSQHALLAISFFVVMVLTIFSTLLYFAERGTWDEVLEIFINSDGDPTQFPSIPAAAWFVLVTITTVGYGEITPRSFLGRLITVPLLVFGLLLIALPSFVLGREFSIVWEKMTRDQQIDESRSASPVPFLARSASSPSHPSHLESQPPISMDHLAPRHHSHTSSAHNRNGASHNGASNQDLTNLKLAKNQSELRRQIAELKEVVVEQGEIDRKSVV